MNLPVGVGRPLKKGGVDLGLQVQIDNLRSGLAKKAVGGNAGRPSTAGSSVQHFDIGEGANVANATQYWTGDGKDKRTEQRKRLAAARGTYTNGDRSGTKHGA